MVSCALLFCLAANGKRRHRSWPRTEVELMNNVIGCLKYKDTFSYYTLFPPFDTLWKLVMHNPDKSPEAARELNNLKEHPQALLEFDPNYNHQIIGRFCYVLAKGVDSGVNWGQVVMQRYELSAESITKKSLVGYERIAPERFQGYMFIRDILGRHTFCISITEIQKIGGYFFGGQVQNILEASSVDEFIRREQDERAYFAWLATHPVDEDALRDSLRKDSIKNGLIDTTVYTDTVSRKRHANLSIAAQEDEKTQTRKEVVDRKYYEGTFDEEIPVKVYIRYMKGAKDAMMYDGLYKFGDQKHYVKLNIIRNADGQWVMDDDAALGSMELELKDKTYTGSWTNIENQTGFDVVLHQKDAAPKVIEQLDRILETGATGKADEDIVQDKKKRKGDDEDDDVREKKKKKKDDDGDEVKEKKHHKIKDKSKGAKKLRKVERKQMRKARRAQESNED